MKAHFPSMVQAPTRKLPRKVENGKIVEKVRSSDDRCQTCDSKGYTDHPHNGIKNCNDCT